MRNKSTLLIMAIAGLAMMSLQACSSGPGDPYYYNHYDGGYGYNNEYSYNAAPIYREHPIYVQPRVVVQRPVYVGRPAIAEHRDYDAHRDHVANVGHRDAPSRATASRHRTDGDRPS